MPQHMDDGKTLLSDYHDHADTSSSSSPESETMASRNIVIDLGDPPSVSLCGGSPVTGSLFDGGWGDLFIPIHAILNFVY